MKLQSYQLKTVIIKGLITFLILGQSAVAQVSLEEFEVLKKAMYKAFLDLRPSSNHELVINMPVNGNDQYWWDLDVVHASYGGSRDGTSYVHRIFLFGGFARLEGMTLDGLALTACHEIGHGIAGAPFKHSGSSAEGQSDYFSTKTCLPVVFNYLKETELPGQENYIYGLCQRYSKDLELCLRSMEALRSDIEFFETLGDSVYYNEASTNEQSTLDFSDSYYPDTQCRLDTMIHGILQIERPKCWYPNGIERKL